MIDYKVKEGLEIWYFLLYIKSLYLVIVVEDKLKIFEFFRMGELLYGVKLVFVNEGVKVFLSDNVFVIFGSLMLVNDEKMVVIIIFYVIDKMDLLYMLIDGLVEIFGKGIL